MITVFVTEKNISPYQYKDCPLSTAHCQLTTVQKAARKFNNTARLPAGPRFDKTIILVGNP